MNRRKFLTAIGALSAGLAGCAGGGPAAGSNAQTKQSESGTLPNKLVIKADGRKVVVYPEEDVVCYQDKVWFGEGGRGYRGCVKDASLARKYEKLWRQNQ